MLLLLDDKNRICAVLCFMKVKELNQKCFTADLDCFAYFHIILSHGSHSHLKTHNSLNEVCYAFMVCVYEGILIKMCIIPRSEDETNMRFIVWFQYK